MAKWVVVIESNCSDSAREDEFNEWYSNTHLSDVLETPGVISATRYENLAPSDGQGKYLAAYEIEAEDLQTVMKAVGENMEKKKAAGRFSDLLQITSRQSFRQICSLSR
ncbi:DUF4286 family protein [Candidatus Poribacteria bacterium]